MKGRAMKVVLRVYKLKETLDREFSSFDEAQRAVEGMVKKDPDLIVHPYVQLGDSCEIDISELGRDQLTDLASEPSQEQSKSTCGKAGGFGLCANPMGGASTGGYQ